MGELAKKLGRYQIVKHLANGGMAQVLLARATGIEGFSRHVVVKRIHSERATDPTFVKMFLDEARLAAALHHHNIVQVHDIGQEDGEYFFAMEYVHGEDLRKLLMKESKRKHKVPLEHVIAIVTAAASALHYAHEMRGPDRKPLGLVHRDVSPANILVGYDGNVKVVDFGIAKAALRSTETQAGTFKGKVAYMAPEQCAGKPVDRRSDVYALGIVMYELTTVRRLFKGDNDFLTMSAIVQGDIPKPSIHRHDIPAELEAIILKALAKSPEDRFPSADAMRVALEKFSVKAGLRSSNSELADYMKSVFGEKPEPWLTDEDESGPELTADFDGSASGVAAPSSDAVKNLAIPDVIEATPSAPIQRARNRVSSNSPPTKPRAPTSPAAVAASASKVPSRPTPRPMPPPPRRTTPAATPIVVAATTEAQLADEPTKTPQTPPPVLSPSVTSVAKATGWGATDLTPTAAPIAWPSGTEAVVADANVTPAADASSAARKRKKVIASLVGAVVTIIVVIAFARRGGDDGGDRPAPPPAAEPARPVVDRGATPPVITPPPPVRDTTPVDTVNVEPAASAGSAEIAASGPATDNGSGSDIIEAGSDAVGAEIGSVDSGSGSGSGSAVKKKRKRKATWNPDELFLK